MKKNERGYAILIGAFVLSAFVIPFTLLTNVEKWYGSFFFWLAITIIVIGINYSLIKDWGKES